VSKKLKRMYAEIAKTEAQDDGTVKVWGYASSGAVDSDLETITPDAMKAAIPDYMAWGAVREMHDATKAAGTAIECAVQDDGRTWFGAHIVDPVAVAKVNANVYKGFSIGGKVTERDTLDKSVIKGIKLYEVSLVDRPANPEAMITVVKALRTDEDDVEELADILDEGSISPRDILALVKAAKNSTVVLETTSDGIAVVKSAAPKAEEAAKSTAETQAEADKVAATELPAGATASGFPNTVPAEAIPEAAAAKTAKRGKLRKSMYSVSNFAGLLQSLAYLCSDADWEKEMEGDDSTVPDQLSAWIASGLEVFRSMATEEVEELIACLGGAAAKANKNGDLAKAASTNTEDLIAKALAPLTEQLASLQKAHDSLVAKNEELGKRAAPGKALLKAIAVSKAADSVTDAEPVEKAETVPAEGTVERAQYEMKKSLRNGIALR
jgi:phage head maturation protease